MIGVSALVMSFAMTSIGGVNQAAATTLFGLWFLFGLGKAFRHILRREIALHREWMIRAFSIRSWRSPLFGLSSPSSSPTSPFTGLTPYEFFGAGFWIGFALHLIAAEVWIQWSRRETTALPTGSAPTSETTCFRIFFE